MTSHDLKKTDAVKFSRQWQIAVRGARKIFWLVQRGAGKIFQGYLLELIFKFPKLIFKFLGW